MTGTATTPSPESQARPAEAEERRSRPLPEVLGLLLVLLLLIVTFSVMSPVFFSVTNGLNMLTSIAVIGIMAVPGTILLIGGQVDLSVGSVAALSGMVVATLAEPLGILPAVGVTLVVGVIVGVINGFLVTIVGVNSLIVTLGGLATYFGIGQLIGDGQTIIIKDFGFLGTARPFLNIPMPVLLFAAIIIIGALVMRYTVYGRQVYAIGANPTAARLVGIPAKRAMFIAFAASSVSAAVAGLILVSQLGAASPNNARGYELLVVTAIVLGGASLSGGRGTMLGTFIGLLIIQILATGLTLLNVESFWQSVATGILLIAAVSFDRLRERLSPTG
jgi:ribose transport system permease protein